MCSSDLKRILAIKNVSINEPFFMGHFPHHPVMPGVLIVEAMAQAAAENPNTPRSIAWALANDDEAAAAPILKASLALSDVDLVAIVEATENPSKMIAIARRDAVSTELSRSLAKCGDEETVHVLLGNANAEIPEDAYESMLDRHGKTERIQAGIIGREAISSAVATRLSGMVSGALAEQLTERHHTSLPASVPFPIGLMDGLGAEDIDEVVAEMLAEDSINASFLVRKLCQGNFEFFCRALAAKAKTPIEEVRAKAFASAAEHLPALWAKAGMAGRSAAVFFSNAISGALPCSGRRRRG